MKTDWIKTLIDHRGVAFVTLNRPEVHNAFDDEMIFELIKIFNEFERDDAIRLVVLSGEGKSFCSGADIHWMKRMKEYSEEENFKDGLRLAELFETINNFTRPVLGKVGGAAFGGGAGLVSVCDYVVAVDRAKFGFTEVRLGLVPAVISPFVISKIGESKARAYFLSGMKFSAQKAYEMQLIHEVVTDKEGLNLAVERVIESFLEAGPGSVKVIKSLISKVVPLMSQVDKSREQLRDLTCQTISKVRVGTEAQEGMMSLLEKRTPCWVKGPRLEQDGL